MNNRNRPQFEDPLELFPRALTKLYSTWLRLTYPFASMGNNVSFHFTSRLSRRRACRISLGHSVSLREYAWLNVATEDPNGDPVIELEDKCYLGFGSMISAKNRIHLESGVAVSQSVLIMDHNHEYGDINVPILDQGITEGGRIRIGQGTWIGHGASIICPRGELTIGRNCVVAANSMVMRSIPPYSVVAGFPATIIRQYDPETGTWRMGGNKGRAARNAQSGSPRPEANGNGFALPETFNLTK
jgi:acetyltransferase-like isoleucine patch superfamily enzyme